MANLQHLARHFGVTLQTEQIIQFGQGRLSTNIQTSGGSVPTKMIPQLQRLGVSVPMRLSQIPAGKKVLSREYHVARSRYSMRQTGWRRRLTFSWAPASGAQRLLVDCTIGHCGLRIARGLGSPGGYGGNFVISVTLIGSGGRQIGQYRSSQFNGFIQAMNDFNSLASNNPIQQTRTIGASATPGAFFIPTTNREQMYIEASRMSSRGEHGSSTIGNSTPSNGVIPWSRILTTNEPIVRVDVDYAVFTGTANVHDPGDGSPGRSWNPSYNVGFDGNTNFYSIIGVGSTATVNRTREIST